MLAQSLQGIQRQLPPRRLGGEKEQPIYLLLGHGLELRKEGAECFADAGGSLGHQGLAVAGGAVHRLGQLALAAAKARVRKGQLLQLLVTRTAVVGFLPRPGDKAVTLTGKKLP